MELMSAYHQIEERLERIDFPALHRGFSRFPFALYNQTQAYMDGELFDKPADFVGNTSVKYRGKHTAIWSLSDAIQDLDVLTSKIVHEMLHAFQQTAGDTRWADERTALVKYRYEPVNLTSRLEEAACMKKCLAENAPEAFSRLLSLRAARRERFPFAYDYEARIEQMEGSAHYVELCALGQLDAEKARRRWESLFDQLNDVSEYFPIRSITYLSGAAFIACLRKYTDMDTDRISDTPFAVEALEGVQPCALPESRNEVEMRLSGWRKQTQETVNRTLEKGDIALEGKYRLIAWNVYDSYWDGRWAVLTHFIGYIEGTELPDTDEKLFSILRLLNGNFIAEMDENLILTRVWRQ